MPTETGTAFLVDPMGHAPVALNLGQYEAIQQLLDLPGDSENPIHSAVSWLLHLSARDRDLDAKGVLGRMVHHYLENDDGDGVLADRWGKKIDGINARRLEVLQNTLIAIRAGGWFAEWLSVQVGSIANGEIPDDCYPTPLKIAASLVDCIREHEETMETARTVVRMRPDLVQAEMPIYPIREAAPETAAAQRARKPRKKVATTGTGNPAR